MTTKINALKRNTKKDTKALKQEGKVPAVCYGVGIEDSVSVAVDAVDFKKVWDEAGESSAIKLVVGDGKELDVIIQDVQKHPITDNPIHVDFLAIDMKKKIEVAIPLEFIGEAPAVKNGVGSLVKVMHELEVEALPADLPQELEVDISTLVDLDSQISASDIKLPNGVELISDPEETIVAITSVQEEPEEPEEPIDISDIEVEKKGKAEEEGGGDGAPDAEKKEEE